MTAYRSNAPFAFASSGMSVGEAAATWQSLKSAIHSIMAGNASSLRFEELYRNAYNLVLHKHGSTLYNGVTQAITQHLQLQLQHLLEKLQTITTTTSSSSTSSATVAAHSHTTVSVHSHSLDTANTTSTSTSSSGILPDIITLWERHQLYMGMIRDICMYMDKTYSRTTVNCIPIYDCGILLFKQHILQDQQISTHLQHTLLQSILHERNSGVIDRTLLKNTVQMLLAANLNDLAFYRSEFETRFLTETQQFYTNETQQLVNASQTFTVPLYLQHVKLRLDEEEQRCTFYMHDSTRLKLRTLLYDTLLIQYSKQLVNDEKSGCIVMYTTDAYTDLLLMYTLFSKARCLEILRDNYSQHIRSLGAAVVASYDNAQQPATASQSTPATNTTPTKNDSRAEHTPAASSSASTKALNPSEFVTLILNLRSKYTTITERSFTNDRMFVKALKDAFESFINLDSRTAHYLSFYVDDLIRRRIRTMTQLEIEQALTNAISIFTYIHDKDIFELDYKQQLMSRLLTTTTSPGSTAHTSSLNTDIERLMIGKLKAECGYQFTSRLEGMFKDVELSKTLATTWQQHYQKFQQNNALSNSSSSNASTIELYANVLTTGFWPTQSEHVPLPTQSTPSTNTSNNNTTSTSADSTSASGKDTLSVRFPSDLQSLTKQYESFYTNLHSGRRLQWQTSLGSGELRFQTAGGRKELVVSTYQMIVLMLYNERPSYKFEEIVKLTNIPEAELTRHLLSLAHPSVKVLKKTPNTKVNEPHHVYSVNTAYTSQLYRNKVPLLSKQSIAGSSANASDATANDNRAGADDNATGISAAVMESRKNLVEAAIVRIMKSRKNLEHSVLIGEVLKQCNPKFVVDPSFIKKRIESLIEREYIERDRDNRRLYHYLA